MYEAQPEAEEANSSSPHKAAAIVKEPREMERFDDLLNGIYSPTVSAVSALVRAVSVRTGAGARGQAGDARHLLRGKVGPAISFRTLGADENRVRPRRARGSALCGLRGRSAAPGRSPADAGLRRCRAARPSSGRQLAHRRQRALARFA